MGDKTGIEWTNATWGVTRGCSRVSSGCTSCYAERVAHRFGGPGMPYEGLTKLVNGHPTWTGKIRLVPEILDQPLRWKKPRYIFVDSTSDLFHEGIPDSYIDQVFLIMALAKQHTFQLLTKRPERMRDYLINKAFNTEPTHICITATRDGDGIYDGDEKIAAWPLSNVWIGTSCEDQPTANERIQILLQCPAVVHWVSAEPLLGAINFRRLNVKHEGQEFLLDALTGMWGAERRFRGGFENAQEALKQLPMLPAKLSCLDWVVTGGESGHGARVPHHDWFTEIRDQCAATHTPFLHKQNGEWEIASAENGHHWSTMPDSPKYCWVSYDGRTHKITAPMNTGHDIYAMANVGKKKAGRLLDGVEHNGYPK